MKNLNEELYKMKKLISAKHGKITFISEADEEKKSEAPKKEDEEKKKLEQLAAKKKEEEEKKKLEQLAAKKKEEEMISKKKESEPKKEPEKEEGLINLKDEIEKYDDDYDLNIAEELDDLIYDLLPDDEINPIKRKIIELIKSQGNYEIR
jgi:hypothetical protein